MLDSCDQAMPKSASRGFELKKHEVQSGTGALRWPDHFAPLERSLSFNPYFSFCLAPAFGLISSQLLGLLDFPGLLLPPLCFACQRARDLALATLIIIYYKRHVVVDICVGNDIINLKAKQLYVTV
jgi:hypothetical protein